jgi:hypothetical protein
MERIYEDYWKYAVDLPYNIYQFKFIADGEWVCGDLYAKLTDGGNENNIIVSEVG